MDEQKGPKIDAYTAKEEEKFRFPVDSEMLLMTRQEGERVAWFKCPCGCGTPLCIPISGPKGWGYSEGPTLNPSVQVVGACNAHFFIRDGKTVWA